MIKPQKDYFKNLFLPKLNIGLIYEEKASFKILKHYDDENIKLIKTNNDYKFDFELSNGPTFEVKVDIKGS